MGKSLKCPECGSRKHFETESRCVVTVDGCSKVSRASHLFEDEKLECQCLECGYFCQIKKFQKEGEKAPTVKEIQERMNAKKYGLSPPTTKQGGAR